MSTGGLDMYGGKMRMELPGKRKWRRPKRRFIDASYGEN